MPVSLIPFFSPIAERKVVNQLIEELKHTGAKVLQPSDFIAQSRANPSLLIYDNFLFIGTGGTENLVANFLRDAGIHPPIILLAYEKRNSLPAAMELRAYIAGEGVPARIIHGPLKDLLSRVISWVRYSSIRDRLRGAKIGLLGKPSSWLVASDVDRDAINAKWGLQIEDYSMEDFVKQIEGDSNNLDTTLLEEFIGKSECIEVPEDDVRKALAVTQKISDLVDSTGVDGISVECFTLFDRTGITGCHALSFVNDLDGMVAGCEGDIPATFTMLLAKLITKKPGFMANVTQVDITDNTATFGHCTIPTKVVENYEILTHFETGESVAIRGTLKEQRITILKVFGEDLTQYWVSGGTILGNLRNETGCRTQILVKLDEPASYFLEDSLANHHVICMGDYTEEFREFFAFVLRGLA
ncbi:MAG: hypothetical protein EAX95_03920 [Candidatus Thorarchaeota archaeon]|nr:hypothetical protein [Candidatus Thorarchaeota archaeon]